MSHDLLERMTEDALVAAGDHEQRRTKALFMAHLGAVEAERGHTERAQVLVASVRDLVDPATSPGLAGGLSTRSRTSRPTSFGSS